MYSGQQQYIFPPQASIPPGHFFADPFAPAYGAPPPLSPVREIPTTPSSWAESPSPPILSPSPIRAPTKRGRGRPKGSKSGTKTTRAVVQSRKAASARATTSAKHQKSKAALPTATGKGKENRAQGATNLPDVDLEDEDEDDEAAYKRWTDTDKTRFYTFLLAQDADGDYRFKQHQKNPTHVYKRASEKLFDGKRTAKSIAGLYSRSMITFTWLVAFESFTGNGGGDPDSDNPTAILKHRIEGARKAGLSIGSLKPETIDTWRENGWWDLFNDRLGASAKVTREKVRNSASALSDAGDVDASTSDMEILNPPVTRQTSSDNIDPLLRAAAPKTPAAPKNPAAIVSEPKHTPATQFRSQAASSFGNISDYMRVKMASEETKAKAFEARLELDQKKLELEREKTKAELDQKKVEMAQTVLGMSGASEEVKAAANEYLLSLFK